MKYPKRGISIDIGNEKIKIIEYIRKKDKTIVKQAVLLDTPEKCVNDGMIADVGQVGEAIHTVLTENKIKSKKVIFTISSSKIITREVDLPDLPPKKMNTLIRMNAEEYFPVNLVDYTLDYRIVERLEGEQDTPIRINIFAALTALLEGYVNLAETLDLKISGIDYSGNSIINYGTMMDDDNTFMVLDFGKNNTMVTIIDHGIGKFNRNLVYGMKTLNNIIQTHFGVSYEEAIKISMDQALLSNNPEDSDTLGNDLTRAFNQILNGVARLMDYYTARNKESIKHIYIVGGGTNINGIIEYVGDYYNIPTKRVDNLIKVSSKDTIYEKNPEFYINAIGAASSKVNLLPKNILNKGKVKAAGRLKVELVIFALAIGAILVYIPYSSLKDIQAERDILKQEIQEKEVVLPILTEHNQKMEELRFNEGIIVSSGSSTEIMLQVLEKMEDSIPTSVDYLSMNNSEEGILISCIAEDKLTVVTLIQVLKDMTIEDEKLFSDVYIPTVSEVKNEVENSSYFTFSVACTYVREVE